MQIERIDNAVAAALGRQKQAQKETQVAEEPLTVDEPASAEEAVAAAEDDQSQGVLRLLQEGHFKGVADVRLRINFFDELQAIEAQGNLETAQEGFSQFSTSLEADVAALKDSGTLTQEQSAALDEFLAQVRAIQDGYDGTTPFAEVIAGLQGQMDALLGKLTLPVVPVEEEVTQESTEEVLTEPVPQELPEAAAAVEAAEEPIVTEIPAQEPNPFEQLVANLRQSFDLAIGQLGSDMSGSGVLPPLSEPSGNGRAYAKFLAIYEEMQNEDAAPEAAVPTTDETATEA